MPRLPLRAVENGDLARISDTGKFGAVSAGQAVRLARELWRATRRSASSTSTPFLAAPARMPARALDVRIRVREPPPHLLDPRFTGKLLMRDPVASARGRASGS